jgi:hypothetical protein
MADSGTPALNIIRIKSNYPAGDATQAAPGGYGFAATGEGGSAVGHLGVPGRREARRPAAHTGRVGRRPEERVAFRGHWKKALEAARAMVNAAKARDAMGQAIAVDELDLALAKLWDLRRCRDIDWQTILNHAQGLLKQIIAAKQMESLSAEQCQCIWQIVERHLGPATKSLDNLNETVRLIEEVGFDPYAALSGDARDGENI